MQFARFRSWLLVSHFLFYAGAIIETSAAIHMNMLSLLIFGFADTCICFLVQSVDHREHDVQFFLNKSLITYQKKYMCLLFARNEKKKVVFTTDR